MTTKPKPADLSEIVSFRQSKWCLFCYKKCGKGADWIDTRSVQEKEERFRLNLLVFQRCLNGKEFLAAKDNDEIGIETLRLSACEDCSFLLEKFCKYFHLLRCLEMKLDWRLRTMLKIMTSAKKVRSRMKTFENEYAAGVASSRKTELLGRVSSLRRRLIRKGNNKLRTTFPKVYLERCNLPTDSDFTIPTEKQTMIQEAYENVKCEFVQETNDLQIWNGLDSTCINSVVSTSVPHDPLVFESHPCQNQFYPQVDDDKGESTPLVLKKEEPYDSGYDVTSGFDKIDSFLEISNVFQVEQLPAPSFPGGRGLDGDSDIGLENVEMDSGHSDEEYVPHFSELSSDDESEAGDCCCNGDHHKIAAMQGFGKPGPEDNEVASSPNDEEDKTELERDENDMAKENRYSLRIKKAGPHGMCSKGRCCKSRCRKRTNCKFCENSRISSRRGRCSERKCCNFCERNNK